MAIEPRIADGPRISGIPIPDPRAAQSGFGEGLGEFAETMAAADRQTRQVDEQIAASQHRIALREQEEQDASLTADRAAEFARMQARVAVRTEELRQEAGRGGQGHEPAIRQYVDEELRNFNAGFANNDRVRQRFIPNMAEFGARTESRETLWVMDERAKSQAQDLDELYTTSANALQLDPTPENYTSGLSLIRTTLDGMGMSESQSNAAWKKIVGGYTETLIDGMFQRGEHDNVKALAESGFFNDKLDPETLDRTRNRVGIEEKAAVIEAEQAASRARQAVQDQADLLAAKVKAGINPEAAEVASVRNAAVAAGLKPDDVFNLSLMEAKMTWNRTYGSMPMLDKLRTQSALQGKIAAGNASETEQALTAHLNDMIDAEQDREAERFKGLLGQGIQGRVAITAQLQQLPPAARFQQAEKVEAGLGFIANLPTDNLRQRALVGRDERKADKTLVPDKALDENFRKMVGRSGRFFGGPTMAGLREVAADIYAYHAAQKGFDDFNPVWYREALNAAMGQQRRVDGSLQGGIGAWRTQPVMLPDNKTQEEFEQILARSPFGDARSASGAAVDKDYILKRLAPVYAGETEDGRTMYRFVDESGAQLLHKDGGPYLMLVR